MRGEQRCHPFIPHLCLSNNYGTQHLDTHVDAHWSGQEMQHKLQVNNMGPCLLFAPSLHIGCPNRAPQDGARKARALWAFGETTSTREPRQILLKAHGTSFPGSNTHEAHAPSAPDPPGRSFWRSRANAPCRLVMEARAIRLNSVAMDFGLAWSVVEVVGACDE